MIKTQNLSKTVASGDAPLTILQGVSLQIAAGESLAIVGASGSGKSTLLGILAGLDVASSGNVWLAGENMSAMNEEQRAALRARYVGFVFQSFQLLPGFTALENVMLPLELQGKNNARALATELLSRVGLEKRLSHYPKQLSGGEQQRVAIARAFACEPAVLFADEPTGNLDSKTGADIIELLFALNQEKHTTLVLVTHEERLAKRCARRIHLEAGKIVSDDFIRAGGI